MMFWLYMATHVYSLPSKDDTATKIMVHPLKNEKGWNEGNQPDSDWSTAAVLPDFLHQQRKSAAINLMTTADGETVHTVGVRSFSRKPEDLPHWWPGASYWGAYYIAPAE